MYAIRSYYEMNRHIRQKLKSLPQVLDVLASCGVILRHQIPFIDNQHDGTTALGGITSNRQILIGDPLAGIDNHQGNVGPVQSLERLNHRKLFQLHGDPPLATDSGGINQDVAPTIIGKGSYNFV